MDWLSTTIICVIIIIIFYVVIYPRITRNNLEEDEEYLPDDSEDSKNKQDRINKILDHVESRQNPFGCQYLKDHLQDCYNSSTDENYRSNLKNIIDLFDSYNKNNEKTSTQKDFDSKKNKKNGDHCEHGLNPFNDPYFRAYLKDYTNLSKEENRKLVAEFVLNPSKGDTLAWLCFEGFYVIPSNVYMNDSKTKSMCDLSTISEFSHPSKPQYQHCFCSHNNNKPSEKYLGRYHSDGILEKLNHQCRAELEDIDENLLTHSMINLDDDVNTNTDIISKPKISRKISSSLNNLDINVDLDVDMKNEKSHYLRDLIKEQQKTLEMSVYPLDDDDQRLLIGAVGDNVIYLSIPQINLFHYLIQNNILQYLKNNWNNVYAFYVSNQD